MGFNIIEASKRISEKYNRYLKTMFDIKDPDYKELFEERINENRIFEKGPFLDVTNSFEKGRSVSQLIDAGILSKDFQKIKSLFDIPNLYAHQEQALLKASIGENLIITTGTGSGKTECFLVPLINELMKEKENGTLCPGVRALLIFPMNALANDQIDRLRKYFVDYPDITFGCYTGQTCYFDEPSRFEKGAIQQYKDLNKNRLDDLRLRNPLPNERLSREAIKKEPPHILITNYAMLEYLMLRPEDNVFFDGPESKYWKYIILDEAHTYTGSTGIEVSMLIRRLMSKLNNHNLQFVLTSATLGDEKTNRDVVNFANNLCSVEFKEENIIRAKRIEIKQGELKYKLNADFYIYVNSLVDSGNDDEYIISEIENRYRFGVLASDLGEYLYNVLVCDETFWKIKNYLYNPKNVFDIQKHINFSEQEISAFVEVASKATKNQSKLFDARYHMFLRATEGVFITLAPNKELFLTRKNKVYKNGEEYKVFEAVTCTQCHSIYLLGFIDSNNHLVQKSNSDLNQIKEAFYLGETVNDTDEDYSLESSEMAVEEYELCPHCGFIRSTKDVHKVSCGHDESHFVKVIKVKTTNSNSGRVVKCISCENINRLGILRGFFAGQEAATSVIGTALFEELPSHYKKVVHRVSADDSGFDEEIGDVVEEIDKAKQFIAFSDNRQAAAYFSSYFSTSYDDILYGRLIIETLNSLPNGKEEMDQFVKILANNMKDNKIVPFDEYLKSIKTHSVLATNYNKISWQAMLKELVDNNSKNSLIGLGLLGINFSEKLTFLANKKYGLTAEEIKDICLAFVINMLSDPAFYCPYPLSDCDKEFFTHNGIEIRYLKNDSSKYIKSFIPKKEPFSNKRLDYLHKILTKINQSFTKEQTKFFLGVIWDYFFARDNEKPQIMFKDNEGKYKVNLSNLIVDKNKKWYRCNKCKKLTSINVHNVCPTYHCDGELEEIDINELKKSNHYFRMYNDLEIKPLRIVEHTAQLNREEAYSYQSLFKNQQIDVLSCSTTFEMGVDVGELETVFMRNMPPSASNYAQRAGRAGRSATSAAFALTFCNRSNHDFNYFDNPKEMICGSILPPHFKIENGKIAIRHLYSSAFSFFFKHYPQYFSNAKILMERNDVTELSGYEVLENFLKYDSLERRELQKYLCDFLPLALQEEFRIDSFGWVDWMFSEHVGDYPSLFLIRSRYLEEVSLLRKEYELLKAEGNSEQYAFKRRINIYEEEQAISFLSRNNILPKYGFPVDTIELELNTKTNQDDISGLELSRDLSVAISEYAPGCEIIANNKLITSRYVRKVPGYDWRKYDYIQCSKCKTLNVRIHTITSNDNANHSLCNCSQCNAELDSKKIKTFLIPEFGFVADEKIGKPSLIKPEKTYRTEASFFNYSDKKPENKYKIGETCVSVALIDNDGEMAMLNTTDFFVCPHCGYAIESPSYVNPYVKTIVDINGHRDSKGFFCKKDAVLERYSLGYKFKTDVIRIRINYPLLTDTLEKKYEEAYSILQSLIISASKTLNIESEEISGCLQYYKDQYGDNYSYILYDKTPGGAGHVKRLSNYSSISSVLNGAFKLATNCCNCDEDSSCYSCLRTYSNQKNHDIIKRKYVSNYLGLALNYFKS